MRLDEESGWIHFIATIDNPDERAFFEALRRARPGLKVHQDADGAWHVVGVSLKERP